ncbi:hypothetical protein [Alicyclobacillus sp. SP_1]|jgi:hypothetical protein|uniref:hypothetical protein n=1 Tax=Alicyclobacillus sp. SP_1 TaxID=2942475 RepID=UPI00215818CE|nr:hypothetical protein [Alicyclobacillus sp. SP_1]
MTPKSKFVTFLLSVFVPGLGHLYLGLQRRGLSFMISFFACIAFSWLLTFIFPFLLAVIWFYALFDALQQATIINLKLAGQMPRPFPDVHSNTFDTPPKSGIEKPSLNDLDALPDPIQRVLRARPSSYVWLGVALVVIGVLALLRLLLPQLWQWFEMVHMDGVVLALLLVGFGIWLIRTNWKRR